MFFIVEQNFPACIFVQKHLWQKWEKRRTPSAVLSSHFMILISYILVLFWMYTVNQNLQIQHVRFSQLLLFLMLFNFTICSFCEAFWGTTVCKSIFGNISDLYACLLVMPTKNYIESPLSVLVSPHFSSMFWEEGHELLYRRDSLAAWKRISSSSFR